MNVSYPTWKKGYPVPPESLSDPEESIFKAWTESSAANSGWNQLIIFDRNGMIWYVTNSNLFIWPIFFGGDDSEHVEMSKKNLCTYKV